MLIFHELKKLFSKRRTLIIAAFLVTIFGVTSLVAYFLPTYTRNTTMEQANAIRTEFDNKLVSLNYFTTQLNQPNVLLNDITTAYQGFLDIHLTFANEQDRNLWPALYDNVRFLFMHFYDQYYTRFIDGYSLFFIKSDDFASMNTAIRNLHALLTPTTQPDAQWAIVRSNLNSIVSDTDVILILQSMIPKNLTPAQHGILQIRYFEIQFNSTYMTLSTNAPLVYSYFTTKNFYIRQAMNSAIAANFNKNISELRQFHGFELHNTDILNSQLLIARYLIDNESTTLDYSAPFVFNGLIKPFDNGNGASITPSPTGRTILDHMFTHLQLATVPLILFACYITFLVFFKDLNKSTSMITVATRRSRLSIIMSKFIATFAVVTLAFFLILGINAMFGAFGACYHFSTAPPILTTFGGEVTVMRPYSLFEIYTLSIVFTLFFFVAITALLCTIIKNPKRLIVFGLMLVTIILLSNFFLSGFLAYRFIPFLALDFSIFWGINSLYSSLPVMHNFWMVFIPIILIFLFIITYVVMKFNKRDF